MAIQKKKEIERIAAILTRKRIKHTRQDIKNILDEVSSFKDSKEEKEFKSMLREYIKENPWCHMTLEKHFRESLEHAIKRFIFHCTPEKQRKYTPPWQKDLEQTNWENNYHYLWKYIKEPENRMKSLSKNNEDIGDGFYRYPSEEEIDKLRRREARKYGRMPPFPFSPVSLNQVAGLYDFNYNKLKYVLNKYYAKYLYIMKWGNRKIYCIDKDWFFDTLEGIRKKMDKDSNVKKWRKFLMEEKGYSESNACHFINRKKGQVVPADYFENNSPSEKAFKALKKGKNLPLNK